MWLLKISYVQGMLEGHNGNGECSPRNRGFELSECLIIGKKMRIAGGIKRERPGMLEGWNGNGVCTIHSEPIMKSF